MFKVILEEGYEFLGNEDLVKINGGSCSASYDSGTGNTNPYDSNGNSYWQPLEYADQPGNDCPYDEDGNAPWQPGECTGGGSGGSEVDTYTQVRRILQSYFIEKYGENFADNACCATSILNEISEVWSEVTGNPMTEAQMSAAMGVMVDSGGVNAENAWVDNWQTALDVIDEVVGFEGDFEYNEDRGEHTIYWVDLNGDGAGDHFVNGVTQDIYYDPLTGNYGQIDSLSLDNDRPTRGFDYNDE